MSLLQAGLIVFVAPFMAALLAGLAVPDQGRLYTAIATYLLASVVAVSVAAEHYHGRIRSTTDLLVSARDGAKAAGWIGLAAGGVIAAAWIAAQMT
ncbi:MAG: hypothetical protein AB1532_15245 [Pseudomonadota bacterium]